MRRFIEVTGLNRGDLLLFLAFVGLSFVLCFGAWDGDRVAIVCLGVINVGLALLFTLGHGVFNAMHSTAREALDEWAKDREYAQETTKAHASALENLLDHDPQLANVYISDLRRRILDRHPQLAESWLEQLDEMDERARRSG